MSVPEPINGIVSKRSSEDWLLFYLRSVVHPEIPAKLGVVKAWESRDTAKNLLCKEFDTSLRPSYSV